MAVENAKPGGLGGWLFRHVSSRHVVGPVHPRGRRPPVPGDRRGVPVPHAGVPRAQVVDPLGRPLSRDWLARLTHLGNAGVPLFFMISGFILSLPFAAHRLKGAEPVKLGAYFVRRLTRLEPPYLISLTAFLVMLRVVNGCPGGGSLPGYLSSFVYLHNLLGDDGNVINGVAWSLEIEVQFYILAPLLALVFAVRNTAARRLLVVAVVARGGGRAVAFTSTERGVLSETLVNHLQYFLAGFVLADVFLVEFGGRTGQNRGPGGGLAWDVVGVAAVLLTVWVLAPAGTRPVRHPGVVLLLAVSAFQGRAVRWALSAARGSRRSAGCATRST